MKRTALLRKAPMKPGKPMARSSSRLRAVKPGAIERTYKIKAKRPKNAPTAAESRYMGLVAQLGCAVCRRLGYGETPAIVHHQRTGQGRMRASHYRTAPLCPPHHQGSGFGVHDMGRDQFKEKYGFSEVELIDETRALLAAHLPLEEDA